MLTLKKSLIILGINILAIVAVPFVFAFAVSMPAWPGVPAFLFAIAMLVYAGIKLWGSVGDVRVELYKRNGMDSAKTRHTLKALRKVRRESRNRLLTSSDPSDREYSFRQLIRAESRIAEIKGLAYEAPEDFRS